MEFKKGVLGINDERYRYDRNDSMMISSVSVCALSLLIFHCLVFLSSTQHIATRFEPVPGGKVDL